MTVPIHRASPALALGFAWLAATVFGAVVSGQLIARSGSPGTPIPDLHFGVYRSWPVREAYDVPVNFRNAQGPLDEQGGLQRHVTYLALPY